MSSFQSLLKDVKAQITEVQPAEVQAAQGAGNGKRPVMIDVREQDEYTQGFIPGSKWIPRGFLELRIEDAVPERDTPVVIYCAGGTRSALAAKSLKELGYSNVSSMAGGFAAWKRNGLTWETPLVMTPAQTQRYSRHIMLPEVGEAGQIKLLKSKVLCLGAGGLGAPSAIYLAAAGVGTLGLVDDDVVDESNLQRQIIHARDRVGMAKVDSAAKTIDGLNTDVKVIPHKTRLTAENVLEIIAPYDVIIDGADNFPTRYLLNDASLKLGKPVIHASIYRFEGQLTSFVPGAGPCYRCLYPNPPPADMAPSCHEAGVLGVLPGVIGILQANEAVKLLLGLGTSLAGRLLVYDALKTKLRELKLRRDPKCPTCGDGVDPTKIELIDYEAFCRLAG
ncbi:MAG: molybdopterin-synthase adenylyltransferase MoeB [Deltaproteobacteria bacterium]|nr:molybdopterin-synthase adenylyltransferase MoeB [Deltaproteobacteria bacterium]